MKNFNKEYFLEIYTRYADKYVAFFRERWNRTEGVFALLALVAVSGLFFVGYVKADTSTTSVVVGNSAPTLTVTLDRSTITLS